MLYALAFNDFSHRHISEAWDEVSSKGLSQKPCLSYVLMDFWHSSILWFFFKKSLQVTFFPEIKKKLQSFHKIYILLSDLNNIYE